MGVSQLRYSPVTPDLTFIAESTPDVDWALTPEIFPR